MIITENKKAKINIDKAAGIHATRKDPAAIWIKKVAPECQFILTSIQIKLVVNNICLDFFWFSVENEGQYWNYVNIPPIGTEAQILWPSDTKSWLIRKDPDAGKDWRQEEKEMTEDEMVGCHHHLNGHEFEQTLGDGEGWGSLAYCSPWGHKESDMTERLNNNLPLSVLFTWC